MSPGKPRVWGGEDPVCLASGSLGEEGTGSSDQPVQAKGPPQPRGWPGDKSDKPTPTLEKPIPPCVSLTSCLTPDPESHAFSLTPCAHLPPLPLRPIPTLPAKSHPWVLLSPRSAREGGRGHPPVCSFPQKVHVSSSHWSRSGTQTSGELSLRAPVCQRQRQTANGIDAKVMCDVEDGTE